MTHKLYSVRFEIEILVVAESNHEAEEVAEEHLYDEVDNATPSGRATIARSAGSWTGDNKPYGHHDGMTVDEWLKRQKGWVILEK